MTLSISGTTGLTSTDTQISYQAGNTTTGTGGFISNTSIIFLGNNTINATMNTTSLKIGGTFGIGGGNALQGEFNATGLTIYAAGVTPQHDGPLHVMSGSAGTWSPNSAADELIVESSGSGGISIATPDASVGYLMFSSPTVTGAYGGLLQYQYSGGAFVIENYKSGGTLQFRPSDGSARGEWNTTGLTCYASGVTPQHDGVLHVMKGSAGTVTSTYALTVESNGSDGIAILTPDASTGYIAWASPSDSNGAFIGYSYSTIKMQIATDRAGGAIEFYSGNGTLALTLNSSQQALFSSAGTASAPAISWSSYANGFYWVDNGSGTSGRNLDLNIASIGTTLATFNGYTGPADVFPRLIIAPGYTGGYMTGQNASIVIDCKSVRATDTGPAFSFNVPTSTAGGASEDMVALKAAASNSTNNARQGDFVVYTRNTTMDWALRAYYNGNVSIRGALSKGSGTFNIEHPHPSKKATHRLVHGFIEGPRNDLLYRGVVTLVNGFATVDMDEESTMTDGTWVMLCRDAIAFTEATTGWTRTKGTVEGSILTITAEDSNFSGDVNWVVIAERHDEHIMELDGTDDNGRLIVEPEMTEVEMNNYKRKYGLLPELE